MFVFSLGNFLFWGALCGKSPIAKVCDPLQQAGASPQQLLVTVLEASPPSFLVPSTFSIPGGSSDRGAAHLLNK